MVDRKVKPRCWKSVHRIESSCERLEQQVIAKYWQSSILSAALLHSLPKQIDGAFVDVSRVELWRFTVLANARSIPMIAQRRKQPNAGWF